MQTSATDNMTNQREEYRSLYLRKRTWRAIKDSRGWHGRGAITKFAKSIGITRQYAGGIVNQEIGCSTNATIKIVHFLGIDKNQCWCHLFEKQKEAVVSPDHPMFNFAKQNGVLPYMPDSPAAALRKQDYATEER